MARSRTVIERDSGLSARRCSPLRLIVPYAPGGGTDIVARVLSQQLTESFGQSVVVDNRPGAGGLRRRDRAVCV